MYISNILKFVHLCILNVYLCKYYAYLFDDKKGYKQLFFKQCFQAKCNLKPKMYHVII